MANNKRRRKMSRNARQRKSWARSSRTFLHKTKSNFETTTKNYHRKVLPDVQFNAWHPGERIEEEDVEEWAVTESKVFGLKWLLMLWGCILSHCSRHVSYNSSSKCRRCCENALVNYQLGNWGSHPSPRSNHVEVRSFVLVYCPDEIVDLITAQGPRIGAPITWIGTRRNVPVQRLLQ